MLLRIPARSGTDPDATAGVDAPELMARVEQQVLARAGRRTAAELARYARDVLKRLDPAGVSRRAKAARDRADVAFYPGEDGMGDVVVHAPVEDAALVKTAVDAYAAAAKSCGDDRPIGVLRVEAPVQWASSYLTGLADGHAPRAAGRPIEIGVTLGLRTALGLDDLPGELPGLGIIPPRRDRDDDPPRAAEAAVDGHRRVRQVRRR